jgi:UPF0042 nucleotide-binding protein
MKKNKPAITKKSVEHKKPHTTEEQAATDILIITGLSGSGMSAATNAFEDLGYFCVDNLPLALLPTFARLVMPDENDKRNIERAALVINIREKQFLTEFDKKISDLKKQGLNVFILFFEASDEVLQRRFSETRRPHPADKGQGLLEAIRDERKAIKHIREISDLIIDTSDLTVHSLRRLLVDKFGFKPDGTSMKVQIISFGHKYGAPRDIDLMFDVRHLPNPYFIAELKNFSGNDHRIVKFLKDKDEVKETLRRFGDLLDYLLPLYKREGKSYVNVAIGCTGGRHRSVMIASELAKQLRKKGYQTQAVHRDIRKANGRRK